MTPRTSCVLLALLVLVGAACDWPMEGFDAGRTGFNSFESRIGVNNVGTLSQAWFQ